MVASFGRGDPRFAGDVITGAGSLFRGDGRTPAQQIQYASQTAKTVAPLYDLAEIRLDPDWYARNMRRWDNMIGENFVTRRDVLTLTFFDVENGIPDQITPNYNDVAVAGRAEAYKVFTSSSNREVTLVVTFQAQGVQPGNESDIITREVIHPVRWISALRQPIIDPQNNLSYAPPPVFFRFGGLYNLRAVVTAADIQWKGPVLPDTLQPMAAEVSVTFAAVTKDNDYANLTGISSRRGI